MSDIARAQPAAARDDDVITWADARGYAAMALAGSWVGYFIFTGMPQLTLHVFPRTLTVHLLFAAAAAVYLVCLAAMRRLPGGTPFDFAALGIIAAYAIATYASVNWRASLESTLQLSGALIAFYALSDAPFLTAASLRRTLMLIGVAVSAYAMWIVGNDYWNYLEFAREVEGLSGSNIFPPTVPRVHDVSDHPNVLAMVLTLIMPFFALAALRPSDRWDRWLGWLGLFCGGWAVFLTLSRGAWIGVAGGGVFTVVVAWLTSLAYQREQQGFRASWDNYLPRDISPTAIAALGGAIVLAAGGTLAYLSSSATRPGWLFRSSLSPREDAWRAGLDIFSDNALFGAGPNTFGMLYPQYGGKFLVHTQHAHNGFLQAADDLGIVGLIALAGLALAIIYTLFRTWREGSLEQRLMAVACAGALIGFSLHNQLDAGNTWKSPAIALALVGAIIVRNYREREGAAARTGVSAGESQSRIPEPVRRYGWVGARAALLALIFVPFIAWWRIDRAHYDYYKALDAWNRGDATAVGRMQDAVNADSSMMVYQMALGQMQATLFDSGGKKDRALIDAAIVHLEQAVKLDSRSVLARANLARAYAFAGRDDDAAREAQLTRLAVHHVPPVLAAGEVYEDIGRENDAIETYAQVISMDAGLADSTYWNTPWRKERFAAILAASSLGANQCTYGAYLVDAHRQDDASSLEGIEKAEEGCKFLVVSIPNDLVIRVALAKILDVQGKSDEAFIHLDYAVSRQPDFAPARTEIGRWYAARGDIEEAKRQWVIGGQLEEAESILLLGNTYPKGQVPGDIIDRLAELVGSSGTSVQNDVISILYYRLRYARMSPRFAMIPGDWQTAVPRHYQNMKNTVLRWQQEARLSR